MIKLTESQLKKFNIEGPRYTSYPTVPVWNSEFDEDAYIVRLKKLAHLKKSYSSDICL